MRLDRLITLGLVQPFRRAWFKVQGSRLKVQSSAPSINSQLSTTNSKWAMPILMYHSISDDLEPGVAPYYKVNTSPAIFRQHMQFLADQGYRTVTLTELVANLTTGPQDDGTKGLQDPGATPPRGPISDSQLFSISAFPKPIVLTFDDGFRDFYTNAFPVLQQHAFTATVFLPTAFIGDERRQFRPAAGRQPSVLRPPSSDCLIWNEVRELRRHGIQFGSHTVNHPKLVELQWPSIASEISDSKSDIEQHLGEPVTAFCYPFAFPQSNRQFVERFSESLREAGYHCCATTKLGRTELGDDPYRLKRLPANSLDDPGLFRAKLEGCYDWLGLAQGMRKIIKRSGVASQRQSDLTAHSRYAGSN